MWIDSTKRGGIGIPPKQISVAEEGAAMLIVMFVLLMTTATATFAVHATASEIQAAGHAQRAAQTEYVADTGIHAAIAVVDEHGPASMQAVLGSAAPPSMQPFEPDLAQGQQGCRLEPPSSATAATNECRMRIPTITDAAALGPRQPRTPFFAVDVNDVYQETATLAGNRADGGGNLKRLHITYTSRGRTQLPESINDLTSESGGSQDAAAYARARAALETINNARAHWVSAPYGG